MEINKQKLFGATEEQQVKFFKFYAKLPMIMAIVSMSFFFIWGIVDPIVFQVESYEGNFTWKTDYGIMQLSSGFLCWLIWILIGAVSSVLTYLLGRFIYSYKLLHIIYLQKFLGDKVAAENRIDEK